MFKILKDLESDYEKFVKSAEKHLQTIQEIEDSFKGFPGSTFVTKFRLIFSETGSPIILNLDHNLGDKPLKQAKNTLNEQEKIVRATVGHVSGYKFNFQSLLTFLIAGRPSFPNEIKKIYKEVCRERHGVEIEPVVWLDQKQSDIPSTNYQAAKILFKLGLDAIHVIPHIGPDSVGGTQLAAEEAGRSVIHVINMTHNGYGYAKKNYFKGKDGLIALEKMRDNALEGIKFPVKIGSRSVEMQIRSVGTIEPANRPYELYQAYVGKYGKRIIIISIGIGPQGALPGCALYGGATVEGIGRFIFEGTNGLENFENMTKKARANKRSALLALSARYSGQPYCLDMIVDELKEFRPTINNVVKKDLDKVYEEIKGVGLP